MRQINIRPAVVAAILSALLVGGAMFLCQCDSARGTLDDKVDCSKSVLADTLSPQFELYFILQTNAGTAYSGTVKYAMERHPCGKATDGAVADTTDLVGPSGRYIAPFTTYQFTNTKDFVHVKLQAGNYTYTYDFYYDEVLASAAQDPSSGVWTFEQILYFTLP